MIFIQFAYPLADVSLTREQFITGRIDWVYPESDIPPIPLGGLDTSWSQDTCPSYQFNCADLNVQCDWSDPEQRENTDPAGGRFCVYFCAEDPEGRRLANGAIVYNGDDFSQVLAHVLAYAFAKLVREACADRENYHTPSRLRQFPDFLAEINRRNEATAGDHDGCATHDFWDANVIMAEAWESLFGPDFFPITAGDADPMQEPSHRLWGTAWGIAKAAKFAEPEAFWDARAEWAAEHAEA